MYLIYGLHYCVNVVTGDDGSGQAVLIRAIFPIDGVDSIRARRGRDRELADGPGKLCQALGIDARHDGLDLLSGSEVEIIDDGVPVPGEPLVGPRIGIAKAVATPWRFRVGAE